MLENPSDQLLGYAQETAAAVKEISEQYDFDIAFSLLIVQTAIESMKLDCEQHKLMAYNERLINEPEALKKARANYEVENDSALQFLEECTLPRKVLRQQGINVEPTTTGEMYKAYAAWAKTNGFYTNTRTEFKKAICRKYNVKTAEELEIHKQQRYYKFDLISSDLRHELLGYC